MARGIRVILAIAAGSVLWALLWNLGTRGAAAAWPHLLAGGETMTHKGILLSYIGYGALLSVLAGFVTASVAREHRMAAVWILAFLHQGLGVAAEVSYWDLMPLWYHLVYLALVIPATVAGGVFRARHLEIAGIPRREPGDTVGAEVQREEPGRR